MEATFHIKRERIHHFHIEHYNALNGGMHFHSHVEILLIRQGEAEVWINDVHCRVRQGELAVVPGYAPHTFYAQQGDVESTILFVPTFLCPEFAGALEGKRLIAPVITQKEAAERIFSAVAELERRDLNGIEQTGYIHVILGTLLRHLNLQEGRAAQDGDLPGAVLLYINEHYKEETLCAAEIAHTLGYSCDHLSKSFRKCFHIGINHYINTVRLKNAVGLMRQGKSVIECAAESGFPSLRTFYRAFTQEFDCSPREYLQSE